MMHEDLPEIFLVPENSAGGKNLSVEGRWKGKETRARGKRRDEGRREDSLKVKEDRRKCLVFTKELE